LSGLMDRWDEKERHIKEGILKEFGKYNLRETCPFCKIKERMSEAFDSKVVKNLLGEINHDPHNCFRDDFMLHITLNPPRDPILAQKDADYWRGVSDKRYGKLIDLIKDSKR